MQQSGFTVYRKHKPAADDKEYVKAGDVVRFFHKEMEAYLVAEGLFNEPELLEDGKCRQQTTKKMWRPVMWSDSSTKKWKPT